VVVKINESLSMLSPMLDCRVSLILPHRTTTFFYDESERILMSEKIVPGTSQSPVYGYLLYGTTLYVIRSTYVTLGRSIYSDIVVSGSKTISSSHARICHTPRGIFLVDLNSRHGTSINDHFIHDAVLQLVSEDLIKLGHHDQILIFFDSSWNPSNSSAVIEKIEHIGLNHDDRDFETLSDEHEDTQELPPGPLLQHDHRIDKQSMEPSEATTELVGTNPLPQSIPSSTVPCVHISLGQIPTNNNARDQQIKSAIQEWSKATLEFFKLRSIDEKEIVIRCNLDHIQDRADVDKSKNVYLDLASRSSTATFASNRVTSAAGGPVNPYFNEYALPPSISNSPISSQNDYFPAMSVSDNIKSATHRTIPAQPQLATGTQLNPFSLTSQTLHMLNSTSMSQRARESALLTILQMREDQLQRIMATTDEAIIRVAMLSSSQEIEMNNEIHGMDAHNRETMNNTGYISLDDSALRSSVTRKEEIPTISKADKTPYAENPRLSIEFASPIPIKPNLTSPNLNMQQQVHFSASTKFEEENQRDDRVTPSPRTQ
jgi:pSer/pThr/pTyr-binding forkhead associated (FHA) protein